MLYILIIIVLLYGSIHYSKNKDKGNKYLLFEYILIVLVMGLRYKVGGDSLNYFLSFQSWPTLSEISNYQFDSSKYSFGWILFSALCKAVYNDFVTLQLAESAIVNAAFFYFFKKNTDKYFIAILLYAIMFLFTFNTEIMRAAMSVSIFLFSFELFKKKKWTKYYLLCIVAFLFHSEAIVMFMLPVCYPLSKININMTNLILILIISIATVSIFNIISQLANLISASNQMSMIFAIYSQKTIESNMNGYIVQILFVVPWLYFLWLSRKEKQVYWRGFVILYIFFTFQQLKYMVFMNRACDMLYPFLIIAIVDSLRNIKYTKGLSVRIWCYISIFVVVSLRIYNYMGNDHWKLFIPYSSVISPTENIEREYLLYEFQNGDN